MNNDQPKTIEEMQAHLDNKAQAVLRSSDGAYTRIHADLVKMPIHVHGTILSQLQASFNLRQHAFNLAAKEQEHEAMLAEQKKQQSQLEAHQTMSRVKQGVETGPTEAPKLVRPS